MTSTPVTRYVTHVTRDDVKGEKRVESAADTL